MKKGIVITLGALGVIGLAVVAFMVFLGNKSSAIIRTIPQNSIVVSKVSVLDIGRKLDLDKIKNSRLMQLLKEESDGKADQMFGGNSGGMGVDFLAPVYLYVYTRADDRRGNDPMIGVSFGISDEADFTSSLQKSGLMENAPPPSKDFNYIRPDGDVLLAWRDDLAILLACDGCRDNTFISEASRLFKLEEKESIVANSEFNSFDSKSADINLFLNKPELQRFLGKQTQVLQTKSARDAFATIPTGLTLVFEDDALVFQSYAATENDMAIEAFASSGLDDADLELISHQAPLGFISLNFNIDEIINTISKSENAELELAAESLRGLGLTLEELGKMIKGNMSLALTSIPDPESGNSGEVIPVYNFHMGIADVPTFDRFMENFSMLQTEGEMWLFPPDDNGNPLGYLLQKNGELVITNDRAAIDRIRAGSRWEVINEDMGGREAGNNPVCMFVDISRLQHLFSDERRLPGVSRRDAKKVNAVLSDLKSFALTGDNRQFRMELKFKETDTNAIMHLFSLAERMVNLEMESSGMDNDSWQEQPDYFTDSAAVSDF